MSNDFISASQSVTNSLVLKVVLLGEGGVGKSSLMTRYVNDEFDPKCAHTVGVEFLKKEVKDGKMTYVLQIWDTAGQERFRSLRTPFYRGSDVCMLIYAVDNRKSFENLKLWLDEFLRHADVRNSREFPFVVIGNKADCVPSEECGIPKREVEKSEAESWCCANGPYPYLEASAKDSLNVQEAFDMAILSWKNLRSTSELEAVGQSNMKNSVVSDSKKVSSRREKELLQSFSSEQILTNETTTIKLGKKQKSQDLAVGGRNTGGCC